MPAAGLIQVTSPVSGWIEAIKVADDQRVTNGTLLYVINNDITTSSGDTHEKVLQALAAQRSVLGDQIARKLLIRTEQHDELQRKADNLNAQIEQMRAQLAMKEAFVRDVTKNYADFSRYQASGIANIMATLTQQQNWMRAKDELEELKSRALRLQQTLIETQFQQQTTDLQFDNEIDGMRSKIADIDQQVASAEARRSVEVRAPGSGRVTAIAGHPGQTITTGARLLTIVPSEGQMEAELLAPSNAIGFVRPGQRVLLRYSAYPYQKFGQYGGTVTEVSHAALQPEDLRALAPSSSPADQAKTFYRVTVEPDRQTVTVYGRAEPLMASMQVDAHLILERRLIYQWILEPLYRLHGA